MHLRKFSLYLVIGMLISGASAPLFADSEPCFTLIPKPLAEPSGPLFCSCNPSDSISFGVGSKLGKMTIGRPGMPLGGGPANCYQTTILAENVNTISSGGPVTVTSMMVNSTITNRKCDTSGCHSVLFGLIKWGGAECVTESSFMGAPIQSWKASGTCEDPAPEA